MKVAQFQHSTYGIRSPRNDLAGTNEKTKENRRWGGRDAGVLCLEDRPVSTASDMALDALVELRTAMHMSPLLCSQSGTVGRGKTAPGSAVEAAASHPITYPVVYSPLPHSTALSFRSVFARFAADILVKVPIG